MHPIEIRYEIYKLLLGLPQAGVTLESPEPGKPVSLKISTPDPYRPGEYRYHRITVTELEGDGI